MSNPKLTDCTIYFHSAPFLQGKQPVKITDKAGFDIYLMPDYVKFVGGGKIELVPITNIKSISYREAPDAPERKRS